MPMLQALLMRGLRVYVSRETFLNIRGPRSYSRVRSLVLVHEVTCTCVRVRVRAFLLDVNCTGDSAFRRKGDLKMANAILSPEFVDAFQSLKSGDNSKMESFVNGLSGFSRGLTNLFGGLTGFSAAKMQDDTNRLIAEQNLEFQKEVQEYNKALQERIFEREDNAVQRRALDLEKVGLSKTLAAGDSAGAGQAISLTPQHNDYQPANLMAGSLQVLQAMSDIINNQKQVSSEVALNNAAAKKASAEAEATEFETSINRTYEEAEREAKLSKTIAETTYITDYQFEKAQAEISHLKSSEDLDKARVLQVFKDMDLTDKQIELIEHQFKDYDAATALKEAQKLLYEIKKEQADLDYQNQIYNTNYYKNFGMPVSSSGAPVVDKSGVSLGFFPFSFSLDATSPRSFNPKATTWKDIIKGALDLQKKTDFKGGFGGGGGKVW